MTQSARIEPDEHGPDHDHSNNSDSARDRRPADHPAIDAGSELDPVHPVRPPTPAPATGLSSAQVAERIARGEINDVPVRSSRSTADIIRGNVFTRFNAIIGVLWAIMLIVAPIQDSLFGFVIIANTGIGIIQELRAKKTLDGLAVIGEAKPTVRRDGKPAEISTSEIVLGDLVELGPGDKVVVDGKVAEADSLEIDESLLTGEADPVLKRPGDPVMSGSFVVAGGGAFTATKVGREAYAAQLAEEASRFTLVHSELRSGISTILKYVTWMMVPTAIGLIISQLVVKNADLKDSIARTVGGIVPMIPEGLVLLTSVAFAIGVIRLGRKQCLVQELPAIEGLARVDVVCLDKTGTLTEGGMDVAEVRPLGGADPAYVARVLGAIGTADPRPNASQKAIAEAYPDGPGWRVLDALPFSSARKYSGARFAENAEEAAGAGGPGGSGSAGPGGPAGPGSSEGSAWLLGAPDVLLAPGDPVLGEIDQLNEQGLRVLLLARAGSLEDPVGARATALVVLEQRLRPDASDTLAYFADQDVTAKVISGDNAVSVGAVAAKLGLPGAEQTVDARTLPTERDAMAEALESGAVFGRVSPQQKRDMVGALQSRGHTVAMTGDGVNDVLALKDADIGVAMGSGSEATRAVAQIVLLNNSFSTLPSVVAEGRRVIGNITRVATLFLTKTVYSVLLAILVVISQVEYPFLPRHLTLLATLTIGVPAFFLALAPNKERARPHFVRRVMRYAIPSGIIAAAATFTTYLLARSHYSGTDALDAETSAATLTLFLVALWVLAIVARPYTWWRIALVATMGLGFLIVLVVPWLQEFFALKLVGTAMPWTAVGIAAGAGVLLEVAWRVVDRRVPA
ncbi:MULTISPECIES: cation-translocating P-type ATPase [Streptomyces]|uniref:Magnesium-transporting ATPase n=1 Tax=Streptomyces tsukubensis (strain DSM 42081 / NBRC 108919 / NRRL 18488 / 9993) TaxID=1114943 RepID=I2N0J9_STRT9|nr:MULTISPECIES: cation-translocating P-type ATPase [Streptomyces]AZK94750.1 magnesium-transporting ATPase [Streptomyces tsukubensis]EIF90546.1 ATPase P [Streptomyces tsukubensis NRRL18488]MYS68684.1 HAD-IC family P-type ATPase [Streptomyces sp. SID5473]QKM69169.1 magnesium-transporting ATPase [Streptomyces tsukubensis NRRL18488]TAI42900.1 HAD family hydrolase [Streptomyces tsukubensis]